MKRPVTVVLLIVVVLGVLICGLRTVVGVGESSVAVVSSGLPQTEAEPRTSQTATSPARVVAAPVQEEAQEGDEDNVVVMHVVLRPFDAAHWEGLSAFSGVSMPLPEQVELGTDVLSQATVDLRAAERAYTETVRSEAAARMADGEESESAFEAAFAMYPHIIEARRDAKRKHSEAAQRTSDHVWEPQTQPWASFLALSATSRTLFDSPSIRPSGELEALANELIASNPDHAVSDHARLLLATLASDPEAASFDPEIAAARIATLVESAAAEDMSEVLEAAARLMVVLPGDVHLEPSIAEQLIPFALVGDSGFASTMLADHALQTGQRDLAQSAREAYKTEWGDLCRDEVLPARICDQVRERSQRMDQRLVRAGWATSHTWQVDLRLAVQECHDVHPLPVGETMTATVTSHPTWQLAEQQPAGAFVDCVRDGLTAIRTPQSAFTVALTAEH